MLAWSEGTDNGHRRNQKSWLWRHCWARALYWLLRSPSQTCHAKPKTQINRAPDATSFFPLVGCLPQAAWPERLLSEEVRTHWHCSRLRSRGARLIVVVSGKTMLPIMSGFPAGRWLWSVRASRLTTLIAEIQRSGRNSQRLMYEQSPRLSPLWLSASSLPVVNINHYVITPLPTKPSATKCQRTGKLANAARLLTCRCVSVMLLRSMQNTRRS